MSGLRAARPDEFEAVRSFYWNLIDALQGVTGTVGWKKGIYPDDAMLSSALAAGELFVLEDEAGIVAAVIVNSRPNEGYAGIPWGIDCPPEQVLIPHALGVRADAQGRGVGTQLVSALLELARGRGLKAMRLDVLNGNLPAERLYGGLGFRFVAARDMYYEDTGLAEFHMFEYIL